jgi:RHH-type proline utilization regulon transcriptional repressor/proline dehydrogenase/delta 1-pyrroline-5-carboxylate dehydrogenase
MLVEGGAGEVLDAMATVAAWPGRIVPVHSVDAESVPCLDWLVEEVSISTNTTAAGGNASLMMLG